MCFALITGASRGIGKSIATELASRKFNILLVARDVQLLKEHALLLNSKYGIHVDFFAVDLTEDGAVDELMRWLEEKLYTVSMLVNNAGYGLSGSLDSYSFLEHKNMMTLNMEVPVALTYRLLPMLSSQKKSYILNVGSSASYQSVPGMNIYAASKSFILSFSRGLCYELRNTSISVSVVSPGATDTDFPIRAKIFGQKAIDMIKATNMSPDAVAKIAVDGMLKGKTEIVAGLLNKIGVLLAWLLPKKIIEKSIAIIYGM
jgi:short-subunit dehydrogenase